MDEDTAFVGDYEVRYMKLDQPFTTGVEYEVRIRLIRDEHGRSVSGPLALFIAFGKTADEGLRNAQRLVQTRIVQQRAERHIAP